MRTLLLVAVGLSLGVGAALLLRLVPSDPPEITRMALAADDGTADATDTPCDCAAEVEEAQARVAAAQGKVAEPKTQSPGLVLTDALGNEIGKVLGTSQSSWHVDFLVYNVAMKATFKVTWQGVISGLSAVAYESEDCSGTPYGAYGLSSDALGAFYQPGPGAEEVEVLFKANSIPYADVPCTILPVEGGLVATGYPLTKLPQPFPMPLETPTALK